MANDANSNPSDDRFIRDIINRKARQLGRRTDFTKEDQEDLKQDLYLRVVQSLPKFDPDKAHVNAFTTAVVERHVCNILRHKLAELDVT